MYIGCGVCSSIIKWYLFFWGACGVLLMQIPHCCCSIGTFKNFASGKFFEFSFGCVQPLNASSFYAVSVLHAKNFSTFKTLLRIIKRGGYFHIRSCTMVLVFYAFFYWEFVKNICFLFIVLYVNEKLIFLSCPIDNFCWC